MTTLREMSSIWFSENVAQEIRKDIDQWLGSQKIDLACKKWPWELIQNAFDAAIDSKQSSLSIEFLMSTDGKLVFSHDGGRGVFSGKELFRLLTRGTTKGVPVKEQEGRFGEGFVVTHVLSELVDVDGTIEDERGFRSFKITIDRRGPWQEISTKIDKCIEAIDALNTYVTEPQGKASFGYECRMNQTSKDAIQLGFSSLREILPYVIAIMFVRHKIRVDVKVVSPEDLDTFSVSLEESEQIDASVCRVAIERKTPNGSVTTTVLMFATAQGHYLAVPVSDDAKKVLQFSPSESSHIPRLFSNLPLLGTIDLPLPCVLFGKLDTQDWQVDKERLDINYQNEQSVASLKQDILHISEFWTWLHERAVLNRHYLFRFRRLDKTRPGAEKWIDILQELAREMKPLSVVECSDGQPRKVTEVIFPSVPDEVTGVGRDSLIMDIWKLEDFAGSHVSTESIVLDWYEAIQSWKSVEVGLTTHTLEDVLKLVSSHGDLDSIMKDRTRLPLIDTKERSLNFLRMVILAVRNYVATTRNIPAFVEIAKIYCDQRGTLRQKDPNLVLDSEIQDSLKGAADKLGYPLREKLLAREQTVSDVGKWFTENLQLQTWTDVEVVDALFEYLRKFEQHLSERKRDKERLGGYKEGLVEFTYFLAQSADNPQFKWEVRELREFPFIWADGEEVETIRNKQLDRCYLPACVLDVAFQRFIDLFPLSVRLSNIYAAGHDINALGQFLVRHEIAVKSPLYKKQRDLKREETSILSTGGEAEQHSLKEVPLTAVAGFNHLLSSIGRGGSTPTPESLLEFVISFLAREDDSWINSIPVTAKCTQPGHKECTIQIYPSEWLLMLKRVSWVPANGGFATPTGENLEPILTKISANLGTERSRELLSKLGCDALNLAILSLGGSDESLRPTIRGKIATIASFAKNVDELDQIEDLVRKHIETSKLVKRNQVLGDFVQRIMAQAFKARGLIVKDDEVRNLKGHDFKVVTGRDLDVEDILLLVRDLWVEVKETNQNEIRLTKPQADAAVERKNKYALCVLDLRDQEEFRASILAGAEAIARGEFGLDDFLQDKAPMIESSICITHIGDYIEQKLTDYGTATSDEGSGVRIETGPQLRIIVSSSIWAEKAKKFPSWVEGWRSIEGAGTE